MKIVNYRNTPFFRLIVPFVIGLVLGDWFPSAITRHTVLAVASIPFFLFILAGLRYEHAARWLFGIALQGALIVLGYFYIPWNNEQNAPNHFSHLYDHGNPITIEGMIADAPVPGDKWKIVLRTRWLFPSPDNRQPQAVSGNILLYAPLDSTKAVPKYGDRIQVMAQPEPVKGPMNPHSFDYRNYLHHQNIHYTAYIQSHAMTTIARGEGNPVWALAFDYRDKLLRLLQEYFPTQDEYAVASALLVGYKEDLSDEIRQAYANTGSMHALAVSGTHVGLLYVGILFLLQRLPLYGRKGRIMETLLALLAIWAFTFLTGATASVLRASVMFSVYLLGKMIFRQANIWNVLSASAFGLLLYNPNFIFDAGFQLSYAAVAGMAFFYPMLYKVSPVMPYRWIDEGWRVLLVGVAAQIGTLPLSLYYFHQFPCYFWLAGWVVVLGGAVFLWAGALLIVLDILWPWLAHWLGVGLGYMLFWMNKIIFLIQMIPGSVISGVWIGMGTAALLYLIILLGGIAIAERRKSFFFIALTGLCAVLCFYSYRNIQQYAQGGICIYNISKGSMIDAWQGHTHITISEQATVKKETYAAQGHRWALGLEHSTTYALPFQRDSQNNYINIKNNIIQTGNYRIAIIDTGMKNSAPENPYKVDAVVVRKNAAIAPEDCFKIFHTPVVVLDNTNSRRTLEHWKTACSQSGVAVHDIRSQGYYELFDPGR